jgi:hypothetical protein
VKHAAGPSEEQPHKRRAPSASGPLHRWRCGPSPFFLRVLPGSVDGGWRRGGRGEGKSVWDENQRISPNRRELNQLLQDSAFVIPKRITHGRRSRDQHSTAAPSLSPHDREKKQLPDQQHRECRAISSASRTELMVNSPFQLVTVMDQLLSHHNQTAVQCSINTGQLHKKKTRRPRLVWTDGLHLRFVLSVVQGAALSPPQTRSNSPPCFSRSETLHPGDYHVRRVPGRVYLKKILRVKFFYPQ